MELTCRLPYERPDAVSWQMTPEGMVCVSTATDPYTDEGNYDWGV